MIPLSLALALLPDAWLDRLFGASDASLLEAAEREVERPKQDAPACIRTKFHPKPPEVPSC